MNRLAADGRGCGGAGGGIGRLADDVGGALVMSVRSIKMDDVIVEGYDLYGDSVNVSASAGCKPWRRGWSASWGCVNGRPRRCARWCWPMRCPW